MKRTICIAALLAVMISGCGFAVNTGSGLPLTQTAPTDAAAAAQISAPLATETPFPTDTPTLTPLPTLTATPTPQMFPVITFAQNANCRLGPGIAYFSKVAYTKGDSAELNGRNEDGTWLWVRMGNNWGYCWVAASTVAAFGDVKVLSVIPYQSLPAAPTIEITRKACGSPIFMWLAWSRVQGAQGYRLYRNGELIETFPLSVTMTIDSVRNAKTFFYALEAFSQYGVSPRIGISEPGC